MQIRKICVSALLCLVAGVGSGCGKKEPPALETVQLTPQQQQELDKRVQEVQNDPNVPPNAKVTIIEGLKTAAKSNAAATR